MPEAILVDRMVGDVAFLLAPEMEAAGVEFRQEMSTDPKAFVDVEQIKRAVINLMRNAIQAMPGGGILTVRATTEDEEVIIDVTDTGLGMPEEVHHRLFEPFFTTREQGSGLGLAIVQQAVEKNRGRVQVATEEDHGTTFTLRLPAENSDVAAQVAAQGTTT